jgi:hypothetical protein
MTTLSDPNDIGALIDALKAEQHRRTQERTDAGEQPTIVVTGIPGDPARGSHNDDGGPVTVIYTGVPRAGDPPSEYDDAPPLHSYPSGELAAELALTGPATASSGLSLGPGEAASETATLGAVSSQPTQTPTCIYAVVRFAGENDPGEIAEGLWSVAGDELVVTSLTGQPLGRHQLREGEDAQRVVRQMLRESSAASAFSRPLRYPKTNVV